MTTLDAAAATVACPSCQRVYEVNAKRSGRTVKCWCGESIHFSGGETASASPKSERDELAEFRQAGMTARVWIIRFMVGFILCGIISIPLSLIGLRMHYFANLRNLRQGQKWRVYVWLLSTALGIAAAIAVPLALGVKFNALSWEELRLILGIMIGGTALGMILTMAHPAFALIASAAIAGGCYMGSHQILEVRAHMTASLSPHLHEYAAITPTDWENLTSATPLQAKVVLVDKVHQTLDPMQYLLPENVQARDAREVGTVAWIARDDKVLGTYPGHRGRAIRRSLNVTLIDLSGKKPIAYQKIFTGGDPPSKGGDEDQYGSLPTSDLVDFLRSSFGIPDSY